MHGVNSLETSISKLKTCVDEAQSKNLLFLAHTGPYGLGNGRSDLWGIDYKQSEGDNGDHDLQEAIFYAKNKGKNIIAVVAGHMHHRLKREGYRTSYRCKDGIHYVNAAKVPSTARRKSVGN